MLRLLLHFLDVNFVFLSAIRGRDAAHYIYSAFCCIEIGTYWIRRRMKMLERISSRMCTWRLNEPTRAQWNGVYETEWRSVAAYYSDSAEELNFYSIPLLMSMHAIYSMMSYFAMSRIRSMCSETRIQERDLFMISVHAICVCALTDVVGGAFGSFSLQRW